MGVISPMPEVAVRESLDLSLAVFYRAEYPRLVGALTLYCGDRELAAELAQEAMARAWRHWPRVRTMASPTGWVYRVGINLANSAFRRTALRVRVAITQRGEEDSPVTDADVALVLRDAVAGLPRRQRTALVLRYFMDLPYSDIADLMRCRPSTARALASQATENLRKTVDWVDGEGDSA